MFRFFAPLVSPLPLGTHGLGYGAISSSRVWLPRDTCSDMRGVVLDGTAIDMALIDLTAVYSLIPGAAF